MAERKNRRGSSELASVYTLTGWQLMSFSERAHSACRHPPIEKCSLAHTLRESAELLWASPGLGATMPDPNTRHHLFSV